MQKLTIKITEQKVKIFHFALWCCFFSFALYISSLTVFADALVDNGINFLKSKQDDTGRITNGFSNPSQWAAVAFSAAGVPIDTVKNPSVSLRDFLLSHPPAATSTVSDWEAALLAVVAAGDDPTNFGTVNYVSHIESAYNNQQIGETYLLNDDMFGLLALIASGSTADATITQDTLNFIIDHQAADGSFSWSPDTTCQFCDTSDDMTAAAIQALQAAKDSGMAYTGTNTLLSLDSALANARDVLISHQNADGGFGYFGTSDADTTSWALMAFNVLGLGVSSQATLAKNWLTAQQSASGGFPSYSGDDTTTTSHALIALLGKGWLLYMFVPPSITQAPTPTASVTSTPTPTVLLTPTPTVVITPTVTPTIVPTAVHSPAPITTVVPSPTPTVQPTNAQVFTARILSSPTVTAVSTQRPSKQVKAASAVSQSPSFSTTKMAFLLISAVSFATALVYARLKLW
ncbi:MAG: hypothetical protein HY429_01870 [Candidatus Levybacteria bacterium]|nr:hypothetical protein [Candidatus Levybacteria bacterium]